MTIIDKEVEVKSITVKLSIKEAQLIATLASYVGGTGPWRGLADNLVDDFRQLSIHSLGSGISRGSVSFA